MPTATFSRPSAAYTKSGQQVASDVPRYEAGRFGQGVFMEEGTTNLLLQSAAFDQAAWSKYPGTSVTANSTAAPNGTTTADTITDGDSTHIGRVEQTAAAAADNEVWTFSVFLKKEATAKIATLELVFMGGATTVQDWGDINLQTGEFATSAGAPALRVDSIGDYWRFSITTQNNATGNNTARVRIFPARTNTLGGASDSTLTGSVIAWGAQLEKKNYPTSHMATTTSAATRSPDHLYATLPQPLPQQFTAAGWFLPEWPHTMNRSTTPVLIEFDKASPGLGDRFVLYYEPTTDRFRARKVVGGTAYAAQSDAAGTADLPGFNPGDPIGWALRQTPTEMALSLKIGNTIKHYRTANNIPFASDLVRLYIGCLGAVTGYEANGTLDAIQVWARDLSDAEVEAFLNATTPPVLDSSTVFLAQLDGDLSAQAASRRASQVVIVIGA